MHFRFLSFACAAALLISIGQAGAADAREERIKAFSAKYCVDCHSNKKARGELNLERAVSAKEITGDFRRWTKVVELIRSGAMPPEDAEKLPPLEDRNAVIEAVEAILLEEAKKHAGDPGVILPRRLSNTEFDLSVRDLTGVDIRPTRDFPADPAGGEGFDNTGEALTMSAGLLKKYLAAAEHVADHLVLMTNGLEFAPFPVSSYNERKKLTEQAVIDFYRKHEVKLMDYLEAAWRYRHREAADRDVRIEAWAKRHGLSGKYLALVSNTLNDAAKSSAYLKRIGEQWDKLPAPDGEQRPAELAALERDINFYRKLLGAREKQLIKSDAGNWPIQHLDYRAKIAAARDKFEGGELKGRQLVRFERISAPQDKTKSRESKLYLRIDPAFGGDGNFVILHRPIFSKANQPPRNDDEKAKQEVVSLREIVTQHAMETLEKLAFGKHPAGGEVDADSLVLRAPAIVEIPLSADAVRALHEKQLLVDIELDPAKSAEGAVHFQIAKDKAPENPFGSNSEWLVHPNSKLAAEIIASSEKFCNAFPNRFFYVDDQRGLAAGFHLVEGFFRDDLPLVNKVLDDEQRKQLDRLWDELDFVTQSAETLLRGFVWFERAERHVLHDAKFDFLRAEDPKLVDEELLGRFERVYLEKNGVKLQPDALEPLTNNKQFDLIHGFFQEVRRGLTEYRERMQVAEQAGLRDLMALAARAYHRPLKPAEEESLRVLYRKTRAQGQSVEDAIRSVFAAVLISPDFCFRLTSPPPGPGMHPLSNDELAGRLSYFLWSSLPDEELLRVAREGKLNDEATLIAQTKRMTNDAKIEAFAREFFGQWLRYRDYLAKDVVTAADFPGYNDALRQAMFEEPTRVATHLIREDRPITDLLTTDITFVNAALAKHYGGAIADQFARGPSGDEWRRVEGLKAQGRGGLFGMSVILAKNSAGARTSPIKRGFWTVHHLLGQHFPPPPADVGELPKNEKEATKTIRELIVEHTANPRCAMCHTHFDGLGMALEGFDPIGRARTKDLAGRPIDDLAKFPGDHEARGIPGLIAYVETHRKKDFVRTLCRKFLGYALGRSVTLSDQLLLNEMEANLERHNYRFSSLFETVVTSPQFRKQRGRDFQTVGH